MAHEDYDDMPEEDATTEEWHEARQKGDDDGVEYADPRDYRDERMMEEW